MQLLNLAGRGREAKAATGRLRVNLAAAGGLFEAALADERRAVLKQAVVGARHLALVGALSRWAGRRRWNGRVVDDASLARRCAGYWLGLPDRDATAHPFPESEAAGILAWLLSVRRQWLARPHSAGFLKAQAERGRTLGQARSNAIRERDHELARLHAQGESQTALAARFRLTQGGVSKAIRRVGYS